MLTNTPQPPALRRVKLQFDKDGSPSFESVTSPKSFKVRAMVVRPPRDVIPVIFVPGIAGTNLRLKEVSKEEVWVPPNDAWDLTKAISMANRSPEERQRLFDPENTEVYSGGDCSVDDKNYWLDEKEAKRRGWGEVHSLSYNALLQRLETSLNDRSIFPGHTVPKEKQDNRLLPEIGLMKYLEGGLPPEQISGRQVYNKPPDYSSMARDAMKAWGQRPKAMTAEEIRKLGDYYYPVWAYGYNWLGDPELAAKGLSERIEAVLKNYEKGKYFRHQGKVILVTHSMGGLIARRAAQMDDSKILGVVHGVCPLIGAAVLYRRLRAGQETGDAAAAVMGNTQAEMTVQLGRSPGAFTLAPTRDYPANWLRVYAADKEDGKDLIFSLPKADPYTEIYAKTTDDVWWGMVDPAMIDPLGVMTGKEGKDTPVKAYKKAMALAKDFHGNLKLYAHPETYGFYGTDDKKFRSFGHVSWLNASKSSYAPGGVMNAEYNTAERRKVFESMGRGYHQSGEATVLVEDHISSPETPYETITFRLTEQCNVPGDGTVPSCSGEILQKLTPPLKEVFGIPGYDHQSAFDNKYAYRATIYCIARIIQKAAPPPEK